MAYDATHIGDLTLRTPVSDYIEANLPDQVAFLSSGAASIQFNDLAQLGGSTITLRSFSEDSTAPDLDDGSAVDGVNISKYDDVMVITRRRRTRGVDRAVRAGLGTDQADAVINELQRQSTYYWAKVIETSMVNVISGLFDASSGVLRTTHKNLIGVASGSVVKASYGALVDTAGLLGDNMEKFSMMLVHSKLWVDLKKENGAKCDYVPIMDSAGTPVMDPNGRPLLRRFYDGKEVILSDQMGSTGSGSYKIYPALLIRAGALAFAFQRNLETILSFVPLQNSDVMIQALAYAAHVRGVKWTGSASSAQGGATDAELATATNWSKVAANKEIGIVGLFANAS